MLNKLCHNFKTIFVYGAVSCDWIMRWPSIWMLQIQITEKMYQSSKFKALLWVSIKTIPLLSSYAIKKLQRSMLEDSLPFLTVRKKYSKTLELVGDNSNSKFKNLK